MFDFVIEIYNYVTTNWVEVIATATAVVVAAERVAQMTPTKRDDDFLAWIKSFFNIVAIKSPNAK